jgi:hypothetical protein
VRCKFDSASLHAGKRNELFSLGFDVCSILPVKWKRARGEPFCHAVMSRHFHLMGDQKAGDWELHFKDYGTLYSVPRSRQFARQLDMWKWNID